MTLWISVIVFFLNILVVDFTAGSSGARDIRSLTVTSAMGSDKWPCDRVCPPSGSLYPFSVEIGETRLTSADGSYRQMETRDIHVSSPTWGDDSYTLGCEGACRTQGRWSSHHRVRRQKLESHPRGRLWRADHWSSRGSSSSSPKIRGQIWRPSSMHVLTFFTCSALQCSRITPRTWYLLDSYHY